MRRTLPMLILTLALASCFPANKIGDDSAVDGDADTDTDSDTDTDTDIDSHGEGWSQADQHGLAAKLQQSECGNCHGEDLTGGSSGVDCDVCHPSDWRTDCTWCHGGQDDNTGAPPLDMDDSSSGISFPEHGDHLARNDHPAWDCDQCHVDATDVLTPGHIFVDDDTPGVAEVSFGGLSPSGSYAGGGSCSNLYCHGNGRAEGSADSGEHFGCKDCHADRSLGGEHGEHLEEGVNCDDCHGDTVSDNNTISDPDQHVDGEVDVAISELRWNGSTCDGHCHGEGHSNEHW